MSHSSVLTTNPDTRGSDHLASMLATPRRRNSGACQPLSEESALKGRDASNTAVQRCVTGSRGRGAASFWRGNARSTPSCRRHSDSRRRSDSLHRKSATIMVVVVIAAVNAIAVELRLAGFSLRRKVRFLRHPRCGIEPDLFARPLRHCERDAPPVRRRPAGVSCSIGQDHRSRRRAA